MEHDGCFYHELVKVRDYACKAAGLDPVIAGWKTAVDTMTKQLADAQATVEALQAQHKDLVLRNKILRDRPDLPAERCAFHDEVEALQRENECKDTLIETLHAQIDAEQEKVKGLENKLDLFLSAEHIMTVSWKGKVADRDKQLAEVGRCRDSRPQDRSPGGAAGGGE